MPLALVASGCLLLPGCASFDDSAASQSWEPTPDLTAQPGPQPELPEAGGGNGEPQNGPSGSPSPSQPPEGCVDHDKAVIGTCLDTVSAVAAIPGDGSHIGALAAERKSGRIMQVAAESDPTEFAKVDVDTEGDGGLTGLTLSPSYDEDQLVYAYVTTGEDNRVVRIAKGEQPKPILTGIPKGSTGNHGALTTDDKGALLVATGDAGDASAAADPKSLAGKVLRIDPSGKPAQGNPTAGSATLSSGLHAPGGMCKAQDSDRLWVTDQAQDKDAIYRVQPGGQLDTPAWTWPDKPGVAGCSDWSATVMIGTSKAGNLQNLPINEDGSVAGQPEIGGDGKNGPNYGKLAGMDMIDGKFAVVGTVNKDGGEPVSSDDRVAVITPQSDGPGGGRD